MLEEMCQTCKLFVEPKHCKNPDIKITNCVGWCSEWKVKKEYFEDMRSEVFNLIVLNLPRDYSDEDAFGLAELLLEKYRRQ